jgi:hypothetical protein
MAKSTIGEESVTGNSQFGSKPYDSADPNAYDGNADGQNIRAFVVKAPVLLPRRSTAS